VIKSFLTHMYCMTLKVYTCCKLLQQNEPSPAWPWSWFQYQLTLIHRVNRIKAMYGEIGLKIWFSSIHAIHGSWPVARASYRVSKYSVYTYALRSSKLMLYINAVLLGPTEYQRGKVRVGSLIRIRNVFLMFQCESL
jgi:hypothetical protein